MDAFFIPSLETLQTLSSYSISEYEHVNKKAKGEDLEGAFDSRDETSAEREKERKKPGRKLANTEPANKRVAQNRIAQRAFRERRQNQVKDLEDQVAALKAQLEGKGIPPVDESELKTLRNRVVELEAENAKLRQTVTEVTKANSRTGSDASNGSNSSIVTVKSAPEVPLTGSNVVAAMAPPTISSLLPETLPMSAPIELLANANATALGVLSQQNKQKENNTYIASDSPLTALFMQSGGLSDQDALPSFPGYMDLSQSFISLDEFPTPHAQLDGFLFEDMDFDLLLQQ
ncbi:hypothetical protein HDU81_000372 [Chytriomyces hyalinus]|nr:hypothetical protein HDU81_000372 [Chytriomyces hyalinus]